MARHPTVREVSHAVDPGFAVEAADPSTLLARAGLALLAAVIEPDDVQERAQ